MPHICELEHRYRNASDAMSVLKLGNPEPCVSRLVRLWSEVDIAVPSLEERIEGVKVKESLLAHLSSANQSCVF